MSKDLLIVALIASAACHPVAKPGAYLYVWAGDTARKASDFIAVINADPASAQYGTIVSSLATGVAGTHPHHTEAEMPADGHLLANGFHAGKTWLFDLTEPRQPRILASFGDLAGFSHPHTFIRLANGHVLVTFQYKGDSTPTMPETGHNGMAMGGVHATGALIEMDERGNVIKVGAASDTAIPDKRIYPYSVLDLANIDRAISTTTDMDEADSAATSEWVQLWRLSDLKLLKSFALKPGPRGSEQKFTGEPRLLPDGKSVYIHTFGCGLYLVRGIDTGEPTSSLVRSFDGEGCGVPILTSHFWLQPVPDTHSLLALDISDPEHPREVSSVSFGADEQPHWIAIDPTGRRVVLNSAGAGNSNRIFIVNFDPATGSLAIDEKFRDAGSTSAGVSMSDKTWPHGFTGRVSPHGTVFSR